MTRMRTGLLLISQIALLVTAAGANAQDAPKIAYVNFPAIVDQAPQTEELMNRLRNEFAPRQRELVAMQTELQGKQETYQRDAPVMGEAERVALEREIRDGTRDLQRADTQLREDFSIRQNEEIGELQRILIAQVQAYVRSSGYYLIVTDALYVSPGFDITADVIAAMQENESSDE
jgi:outer membrane protein